jgi:predicted MFS family arabinose efflux permease
MSAYLRMHADTHQAVLVLDALRNATYRRLFLAQVIALAGTGLATVALGLIAYDVGGDRAGSVLGTAFAIKMLAFVLVAPAAAALLARLPRRAVMVGADLVRLAAAACLPWVDQSWQIYLLVLVLQSASATFTPAFQATIPAVLADERDYTGALSLSRLAYDLEAVLSPVLAAALLLVVPDRALFLGTAAGFGASDLVVVSSTLPRTTDDDSPAPLSDRMLAGARLMVRGPALRPVLALNVAVAAAGATVLVQTVVIVRGHFGQSAGVMALVLAANGAGSMLTAFTLPRVLTEHRERAVMLGGAVVATAGVLLLPLALRASSPVLGLLAVSLLWLAVGVGWAMAETPVGRIIRRAVDPGRLPAVFAAQFSLSHAGWLLTYPLSGALGTAVGSGGSALALGVVAAVATGIAATTWPSTTRDLAAVDRAGSPIDP